MLELLKMIEEVDASDEAKIDEISARAWCYLNKRTFISYQNSLLGSPHDGEPEYMIYFTSVEGGQTYIEERYADSRDALKEIRPKGWYVEIIHHPDNLPCANLRWCGLAPKTCHGEGATEELAELSAILQATEYERTKYA